MPGMSSLEEREIRDYVASQQDAFGLEDQNVEIVQRVGRRRISGKTYVIYDVKMSGGSRWWVITEHINLYSQHHYPRIDDALTHHIGLMSVVNEQFRIQPDEEQVAPARAALRRYESAVSAMAEAVEAEDFQSVGIRCRDALIALGMAYVDDEWVVFADGDERPKAADAKGWLRIYADSLSGNKRQHDFVRALVEKAWDAIVALQHDSNATEWDAEVVLIATQAIFRTFGTLLTKQRYGEAERCPECDSYRLRDDSDGSGLTMEDGRVGTWVWRTCESCGWESEKEWDNWDAERLRRMADYLSGKERPPRWTMKELDPGDEEPDDAVEPQGGSEISREGEVAP
jgi:hypothetical protein